MANKVYEVTAISGRSVFGHNLGERFTASLTPGVEAALVGRKFLAVVEERPRPPRRPQVDVSEEPSEAPTEEPSERGE